MKLLVDMNLSPDWVPYLNQNGHLAFHWSTVGVPTATDSEIMAYAVANEFVVLTHDLDFGMLLAAGKLSSPSVIQIRAQDVLPDAIGVVILRSLAEVEIHLKAGALVTIEPARHRIRLLPI